MVAYADMDRVGDKLEWRATLLDAVAATTNGEWLEAPSIVGSVHISGITTAKVVVNISNAAAKPADSAHNIEAGFVVADGFIKVDVPFRWIKARVDSWTSGTITARLEAFA